jgi:hypothetical protein
MKVLCYHRAPSNLERQVAQGWVCVFDKCRRLLLPSGSLFELQAGFHSAAPHIMDVHGQLSK